MSSLAITLQEDVLFRLFLRTYVVDVLLQERWKYLDGISVVIERPDSSPFNIAFYDELKTYCTAVGSRSGVNGTYIIRENQVGVQLLMYVEEGNEGTLTFSLLPS